MLRLELSPIIIILNLKPPYQASRSDCSWKRIKMHLIRASAEQLPRPIYLSSPEEIDYYLNILFAVLSNIMIKMVSFAKLNIYTVP
jgi:hypothetical protein